MLASAIKTTSAATKQTLPPDRWISTSFPIMCRLEHSNTEEVLRNAAPFDPHIPSNRHPVCSRCARAQSATVGLRQADQLLRLVGPDDRRKQPKVSSAAKARI